MKKILILITIVSLIFTVTIFFSQYSTSKNQNNYQNSTIQEKEDNIEEIPADTTHKDSNDSKNEENFSKENNVSQAIEQNETENKKESENTDKEEVIIITPQETVPIIQTKNFYKVSGTKIIDSQNNTFIMKGMGFGNNVWANKSVPITNYNDESHYKELSNLGFNSIRYYLNTNLLIDTATGKWNEEGFTWLNQNIEWAKKHNIVLELNLHVPPGGFMSSSNANFWKDNQNLELFKKIWFEIANRYKDEETIIGYGLMNEPFILATDATEALNKYYTLINDTIASIRKIDKNHIFFIESPYGYINNGKTTYYDYTGSFQLVNDSNVVYEYHYYFSNDYTAQGISYKATDSKIYYNNDYNLQITGGYNLKNIIKEDSQSKYDYQSNNWQYIESPLVELNDGTTEINSAYWLLYFDNIGENGSVYIDELVIKEYDENKNYLRDIKLTEFTTITSYSGWDLGTGGGGKITYTSEIGNHNKGSIKVSGVTSSYRIHPTSLKLFQVNKKHYYTIGANIKFENCTSDVKITPAFQLAVSKTPYILNKNYLEFMLKKYVSIGTQYNVPIYIGEFGVPAALFGNEYNGEGWMSDFMDLLKKYNLNYAYHDFHNPNWGYYSNEMNQPCAERNEFLKEIFKSKQ